MLFSAGLHFFFLPRVLTGLRDEKQRSENGFNMGPLNHALILSTQAFVAQG